MERSLPLPLDNVWTPTDHIDVFPGGSIDVSIFLGVPAILLAVATVACWLPARRAAGVIRWWR